MSWQPDHDPTVDLRDQETLRSAVAARGDQRLLTRVAAESATFAGTLLDLAERRVGATLHLDGELAVQGVVVAIGPDHVVVATETDQRTYVMTTAIVTARADRDVDVPVAQGQRDVTPGLTLMERLARWEEERAVVAIVIAGRAEPLRGRLVAVGEDVVSMDLTEDRHPSYVPARAILAVLVDTH